MVMLIILRESVNNFMRSASFCQWKMVESLPGLLYGNQLLPLICSSLSMGPGHILSFQTVRHMPAVT